jgi:hypothetical protein
MKQTGRSTRTRRFLTLSAAALTLALSFASAAAWAG